MRVAIVTEDPEAPLVLRLAAELRGIGLDAVIVESPLAEDVLDELEQATTSSDAVAGFSVKPHDAEVMLLVPTVDRAVVRDLGFTGDPDTASQVVGMRAAEVLRAGLVESRDLNTRAASRLSLRELATLEARQADPASVALSGGPMFGSLAERPQLAGELSVAVPVAPTVSVLGQAALPMIGVQYRAEPGAVRATGMVVGGGARYAVHGPAGTRPDLSVGACAVRLQAVGESAGDAVASTQRVWRFAPWVSGGLSIPVVDPVRLRGDLRAEAFSPVRIHLAEAATHTWGPVQTRAMLGLEVSVP